MIILQATAEAGNMSAISRAKTEYEKIMKAVSHFLHLKKIRQYQL